MDSALTTVGLPIALAIIMFGLGLGLTVDDFRRIGRQPKAVLVALACQLLLLPVVCFGLVIAFDLPALLGIGMMLLAASPGGTTANLFSHLFRGDVALNITLTAINTVVAIATLPLITNLTIAYFEKSDTVSMPLIEVAKVFVLILVPVAIGMVVNARRHDFAQRMDRPVRIGSAVGLVAALFCATSLVVGYVVPRAAGVPDDQAIASSFEIGVHNGTLAIFVAVEVLDSTAISVPAAVYSVFMFVLAALWGMTISRRVQARTVAV